MRKSKRLQMTLGRLLVLLFWTFIWIGGTASTARSDATESEKASARPELSLEMEQVVVTGSRTPTRDPKELPVPVQVITREQILQVGAFTLAEALEIIQGVELIQSPDLNAAPGVQTQRMRGMDANHVLVLIDGRRQPGTRPDNQGFSFTDISTISIDNIERIEVLRDGASAQYGSDAVAGVINIVMRKNNPRLAVNSKYGLSSRSDLLVGEKFFYNASAFRNRIDSYDRTPDNPRWSAPEIDGLPSTDLPLHAISHRVGTLFQDPEQQFFATSVEDEIAFTHEWRERQPHVIRTKVASAAAQFGLARLLHRSLFRLSEGEKQKVVLAAIMSLGPGVLVLDKPTANLDPESTAALALKIAELKKAGMAILIVDHRLYWLTDVVDRVYVMEQGRIAASWYRPIVSDHRNAMHGSRTTCSVSAWRNWRSGTPNRSPVDKNSGS